MKYRLLKELYDCSFISGFELAQQLSMELNNYKKRVLSLLPNRETGHSFHISKGTS